MHWAEFLEQKEICEEERPSPVHVTTAQPAFWLILAQQFSCLSCGGTAMESSPNKRFKTLTQSPNPPSIDSKGKSKIQDRASAPNGKENENEAMDCCGICLSEAVTGGGGVSRGFIDSCDHYFCFVCIMEWAKVESKCPLCKRRFSAIRRPPKPPLFASERIVHVPVRDQVYCNFGNATIGPPNPYSDSKCSICHSIADENLLLLCDLCDSASHTYCIGLGVTVPEGDWFCQDCTLLRCENLESETKIDSCPQISFPTGRRLFTVNENVSVSDIVREPYNDAVQSSRTTDEISLTNSINSPISRPEIVRANSNARTLQVCHNVHDRIRILRENWDGFQTGKFRFNTNQGANNIITSRVSVSSVNERNQVSAVCSSSQIDSGAGEITKAWKMLDKAKSIKKVHEKSAKRPMKKLNVLHESNVVGSKSLCANSLRNKSNSVLNIGPANRHCCPLEKDYGKQQSLVSGKEKYGRPMSKTIRKHFEASKTYELPIHQDLESSRSAGASSYLYSDSVNVEKLPTEKSFHGPCLPASLAEPVVSSKGHVKDISAGNVKRKSHSEKVSDGSKQYYDAKSEIQSLVKLNLKLQMKDEKLGTDAFKEVARLATHSILAACNLEQPKPGYFSSSGFICSHPRELWQPERSSLMPDSCSPCFYVFVKNMVNDSLLHRKRMQGK